ncbi:MAG: hypothetical protein ACI4J0_11530 [Huintestinicola sp.]|uniref:hypothetical protein n=1 Tax=Huintestinicola sp. TaxID=2981661 RepID=UPI003F0C3838
MKKSLLMLACMTFLLTACGNETREPEETDMIETTAETLSKNVEEPDDDTVYPWLDLTEFAEESYRPIGVLPAGGDSIIVTYDSNKKYDVEDRNNSAEYADYISCIDITDKKEFYRIDAHVNDSFFQFYEHFENGKKSVCAVLGIVGKDKAVKKTSLIEFSPDGEYKLTEDMGEKDIVYSWGERAVSDYYGSISNVLDGSMIMQAEKTIGPEVEEIMFYRFSMPLDENRFLYQIYRIEGWQWVDGIGIYDLEQDSSAVIPDSRDSEVLGVHNGNIYTLMTNAETTIYVTDSENLESRVLCGSPFELGQNDFIDFNMTESGEYFSAYKKTIINSNSPNKKIVPAELALLGSDTGKIIKTYSFGAEFESGAELFFTDSYICFFDYQTNMIYAAKRP